MKKSDKDKRLIASLRMSTIAVEIAFTIFKECSNDKITSYMTLNESLAKEVNKDIPDIAKVENLIGRMSILANE